MKNVLLVDDDNIFNFINTQMLKQTGMASEIHTAMNGKQAIDYLNDSYRETSSVPDVILLDLNMPVMNGFDFLEAFKIMSLPDKEKEHVNIIVVTSSENQQDIDKARHMGANHYLTKPLSPESLKHALEYSA
jgi:CheY-like chemotaxis protein